MNPVLIMLILIGAFLLWLIISFLFFPLGKGITKIADSVEKNINKDDLKEKDEELKEENKNEWR